MTKTPYKRVDVAKAQSSAVTGTAGDAGPGPGPGWLRWMFVVLPLAILFCIAQALTVVLVENIKLIYMSSTLIAVMAFVVLVLFLLLINPAIRVFNLAARRVFGHEAFGRFTRFELITLFAAITVSSGVSSFGLTAQLVPIIPAPFNPEWNIPIRGWQQDVIPHLNQNLYISDPDQVRLFREGVAVPKPIDAAPIGEKIEYLRDVFDAIPWYVWVRPLASWMIFIFGAYGLFYCLSYVVLNYWSEREKLIFPLAQLPEALLPESDNEQRWWPRTFCHPLFWAGFVIAAGVLSWNACVGAGWVGGMGRIPFGIGYSEMGLMFKNTPLEGITYYRPPAMQLNWGFVAIGIAFLLPTEISFSIWFYFVLANVVMLSLTWMGYRDFPSNWLWHNHPVTGMGAGGLLLFSAVSLYRSIKMYIQLGAGKPLRQRVKLALPVVGLVVCITIVTGWLHWNGLPFIWGLIFIGVTSLVTLGVMRIVAEGGLYWIQMHVSFFHLFKILGLGRWLKPALIGPLLPIYYVLFLDIKTFIAPNILNTAKIQQDVGGSRTRFHTTVILSLLVSMITGVGTAIFVAYMRGGRQMAGWFYSSGPKSMFDTARIAARTVPEFDPNTTAWYGLGAIWVGLSMFARQSMFWFPHPIGFIMQANPLTAYVWVSFLIGWVFKKFVVKYGGKATYDTVKLFFLGMIIGEVLCVFVWPTISVIGGFGIKPGIDLNRYGV